MVEVVWLGFIVGALLKLCSPHRNWVSWIVAALVGGAGATIGMFVARLCGVNREYQMTTLAVAATVAAFVVILYAVVSRVIVRKMMRRSGGRMSRPTLAF